MGGVTVFVTLFSYNTDAKKRGKQKDLDINLPDRTITHALMVAHEMYQKGYEMPGLWETDRNYREFKESL